MKVVTIAQQPENSSIWTPESVSFSSQGSTRTFRDPSQQKRVHRVLSEPLESHQRGFEPLTEGLQPCDAYLSAILDHGDTIESGE